MQDTGSSPYRVLVTGSRDWEDRAATPAEPAMARAYEPLARWLYNTATSLTASTHPDWQACVGADALAVARAILGTPEPPR